MQINSIISFIGIIIIGFIACNMEKTQSGEELAQLYCGSCHLYPSPQLLDKYTWEHGVLPQMGLRMGIPHDTINPYESQSYQDIQIVMKAGIYPKQPTLSQDKWEKIVAFYLTKAPDTLEVPTINTKPNSLFQAKSVNIPSIDFPMTTYFDFQNGAFHLSDARNGYFKIDSNGSIINQIPFRSPISDIHFYKNNPTEYLLMGYMHPKDEPLGKLISFTNNTPIILMDSLIRPVDMVAGDLDNDGLEDKVVCSFGNHTGKLSWLRQLKDGTYEEQIIHQQPGAIKVYLRGWNNDVFFDIVVLSAQGDERIDVYLNQGDGTFKRENLLRFPAVYGSSYFELVDFDNDGDEDILYTNGDNADYSITLKPYHGIHLFLNNNGIFEERHFLPMHGVSKAIAKDFDTDGDLDIAAISFFPDFDTESGFYYFENKNGTFERQTISETNQGRWLTLTSNDYDTDGDEDLMLGSFIFSATAVPSNLQERWQSIPINGLILENRSK